MLHDVDPSLSAQIAVIAHRTEATSTTRSALLSATAPLPGARALGPPGQTMLAVGAGTVIRTNAGTGTITVLAGAPNQIACGEIAWGEPTETVFSIAASDTGRLVLIGGGNGTLALIDLTVASPATTTATTTATGAGAGVERLEGDRGDGTGVGGADGGPDGGADGGPDGGADGQPVTAVAIGAGDTPAVVADAAGAIGWWRIGAGPRAERVATTPSDGPITSLALAGDLLATGYDDGTVTLRTIHTFGVADSDSATGEVSATTRFSVDGQRTVGAVALSADGATLIAGYHDGTIRLWRIRRSDGGDGDAGSGDGDGGAALDVSEVAIASAPFATWVNDIDISPDGSTAAVASSDGTVRQWNLATGRELRPDLRHPTIVNAVRFDGPQLYTGADDGTVRMFDTASTLVALADGDTATGASIWSATFSRCGTRLLTVSHEGAVIHHHDTEGEIVGTTMVAAPEGLVFSGSGAIAPDGSTIAVGTRTESLVIASVDGDRATMVLDGLHGLVEFVDWSPTGSLVAAVDDSGGIRLWSVEGSTYRAHEVPSVKGPALGLAFDPAGTVMVVTTAAGAITVFDVSDPDQVRPLLEHDTSRGADGGGGVSALCVGFHPTAPLFAVGHGDKSVSLWQIDPAGDGCTVREVARLRGPGGHVMAVHFSTDGTRLAAGVTDGRAWVWDTGNLEAIVHHATITSSMQGVYAVAISPDGRTLVGAGAHRRMHRWTLDDDLAIARIAATVGDTITEHEWASYVPSLPYDPSIIRDA